jgi:hypothetical protein
MEVNVSLAKRLEIFLVSYKILSETRRHISLVLLERTLYHFIIILQLEQLESTNINEPKPFKFNTY